MINLSSSICYQIRQARRAAKLSQGEVSAEVGCRQSALSMFEQGDGTKLNDDVVKKLAAKFGIDLEEGKAEVATAPANQASVGLPMRGGVKVNGFCPNPHCPTNHAYEVEGRVYFRPERTSADPVGGRYCAFCGEVLEKKCPNCGAPLHEGAVCSFCGEPYVASVK